MPSTSEISLNHPNHVYYSGQVVSGSITLNTTSEKNVRNIRIRFLGEAKVHWEERESYRNHKGQRRSRTVNYRGNEVYVDNTTIVHGEGVLQPGTYTYNFNIALPVNCPTSCEGKYGKISYELCLTLDRPFRFDNEFSFPLTVLRMVDLNLNPTYRVPIETEEVSSIGCWPCASGDILYNLTIPQGGYAPGQTLRYRLHVQNDSMSDINGYRVDFVENMTFTAHEPYNKSRDRDTILEGYEYDDVCLRHMNRIFEGEIELPPMPPTTEGSGIISIEYSLDFELFVSGCHSNNTIDAVVFIGSVPLREVRPQIPVPSITAMPQPYNDQYTPVAPSAPPPMNGTNNKDAPPNYMETQPPSFAEATRSESPFLDPDANEHKQIIGFKPLYPMYPSAPEKQ